MKPSCWRASGTKEDVKALSNYLDTYQARVFEAKRKLGFFILILLQNMRFYSVVKPQHFPTTTRDKLIYFERGRTGLNDSQGFPVDIYGTETIKTN